MGATTVDAVRPQVNDRREIFGWMMYDWANSAFSTTTVTVFLGPYLSNITKAVADARGLVYPLGIPVHYNSFFTYCVSLSVLLQVFFLPLLGAVADYSHLRKRMLMLFCVIGAVAATALFVISPAAPELYWLGGLLFIIANLAFGASVVFYNAYLPDIASLDRQDTVSSQGWGVGYLGGGLLLLLNLLLFNFRDRLGLDTATAVRICLASAGLWWLLFAQVTFSALRPRHARRQLPPGETYLTVGFHQLAATFREARHFPETLRYLLAYLLYNDGVQTVIVVSILFGAQELGMDSSSLILLTLMVQMLAFAGAFAFGWLARQVSAKSAVLGSLVVWSAIVIYAFALLRTEREFWVMGAIVALVLGGTQALSRSLFAKMIPPGREAEFFGIYEVSDKGTSWIGTLLFGLANQAFGGLRYGILSLIVLFVTGLIVLATVNVPRAIREAGRAEEA